MTDSLSALLSAIQNASRARFATMEIRISKFGIRFLEVLRRGGYIRGFQYQLPVSEKVSVLIQLKYTEEGPAVREIRRLSSPGKRTYASFDDLRTPVSNGLSHLILSTSKGILYDHEARLLGVGGEVLCAIR
uniref:Ribosomal protein S8 n=1 Tax=Andalucia godoyi TaxID=505711 RepID=M4Q9E6_ANDGO|nr:ribosomal protein S8 [Andalucia godoyi]AGH23986.1 ribosomal protein S8 [Andalucia godoyi]